jgi:hypothetical protein
MLRSLIIRREIAADTDLVTHAWTESLIVTHGVRSEWDAAAMRESTAHRVSKHHSRFAQRMSLKRESISEQYTFMPLYINARKTRVRTNGKSCSEILEIAVGWRWRTHKPTSWC